MLLRNRASAWITSKCHSTIFLSPPPIYILLLGCTSATPQWAAPQGQSPSSTVAIPEAPNNVWYVDVCKGRLLSLTSADATFSLRRAAWTTSASYCCASLEPPSCLQRHYTRRLNWRTCSNPKWQVGDCMQTLSHVFMFFCLRSTVFIFFNGFIFQEHLTLPSKFDQQLWTFLCLCIFNYGLGLGYRFRVQGSRSWIELGLVWVLGLQT